MLEALLAGLVLGATHAVPPGPITFEVIRRGIVESVASSLKVNLGAVVADAIFFLLIVAGLLQVINSPAGKIGVWVAGCMLLFMIGLRGLYKAATGKGNYNLENGSEKASEMSPFFTGLLICLTSPFAIIWWAGVFAGSIALLSYSLVNLTSAFLGIAIACFAWYALVGASASAGRRFLDKRMVRVLSLICSIIMIGYAFLLAYNGYVRFIF